MAAARSRNEFRLVSARPNLLFSLHVGMSANNGLSKLFGFLVVPPAPTGWPGNKSAVLWCLSYTVDCVVPFRFLLDIRSNNFQLVKLHVNYISGFWKLHFV